LTKSKFSAIGLIILLSTFIDSFWFRSIRENVNFTSALIDMILTVCQPYGVSLTVTCGVIVAAQTCVLLWWGVFFVGLIANASTGYAEFLILVMGFSMFWISQFFRAFMSFVIGGCVLWPFVRDERDSTNNPSMRVLLHVHCAVTTSLGSLCKVRSIHYVCVVLAPTFRSIPSRSTNIYNHTMSDLPIYMDTLFDLAFFWSRHYSLNSSSPSFLLFTCVCLYCVRRVVAVPGRFVCWSVPGSSEFRILFAQPPPVCVSLLLYEKYYYISASGHPCAVCSLLYPNRLLSGCHVWENNL
jgi:hypothetical protein